MGNVKEEKIGFLSFSHHDLGWHKGSFANETAASDNEINTALDIMQKDPEFTWIQEHGRYVGEYLKNCPERREELAQRVKEGRFELGAGYSSPYTSFVSNELLVRQFIYGKKWLEETFPGCTANVYYNTDVPGLGMQMPQILKKSGVDYLYASRSWNFDNYKTNEFKKWEAPDGSDVNVLFMHHYGDHMGENFTHEKVEGVVNGYREDQKRENLGDNIPFLYSMDCIVPEDFREKIKEWNDFAKEKQLPQMEYQTMQQALAKVFTEGTDFSEDTLRGEWPNKWFYENAASDHTAFSNQRDADRYLRAAETLAVLRAIVTGDFSTYPQEELAKGWRAADHACHGYAPAESIREFREIYELAVQTAKALYKEQLSWLVAHVNTDSSKGNQAVVIYNTLSWERTDVVTMEESDAPESDFVLADETGKEIAYQRTVDGKIVFLAENIPAMGYRTFYMKSGTSAYSGGNSETVGKSWESAFENAYYILTPGKRGGLEAVVDKEAGNRNLFDTSRFQIGEFLDFKYDGMGAGEQLNIWQPHTPVRPDENSAPWTCVESGAVRTVFETTVPKDQGSLRLRLTAYEQMKKIDFDVLVDNSEHTPFRQYRLMFPVNSAEMFDKNNLPDRDSVKVSYEVPFGRVTVGEEVLKKFSKFNDNTADPNDIKDERNEGVRPREVQNWISVEEGSLNVTFSSYNLGWDYQDPTADPVKTPVLQPVLMSSSNSCHEQVDSWLQPGEHSFHFTMTSGENCEIENHRTAVQANNPLEAVVQTAKAEGCKLPEVYQGFGIDSDHAMITAVKKAEDSDAVVVRYYEAEGKADSETVSLVLPETVKITSAGKVNLIEQDQNCAYPVMQNQVSVPVNRFSIETVRISTERR